MNNEVTSKERADDFLRITTRLLCATIAFVVFAAIMLMDSPMRWLTTPLAIGTIVIGLVHVAGDITIIRTHRDHWLVPTALILLGIIFAVFEVAALYAYSSVTGGVQFFALLSDYMWSLAVPLSGALSVVAWGIYRLLALNAGEQNFYTWGQTYEML